MTETEIAGLASYAMRKAGSEWEWSFTGGNEIASGYRTGLAAGACTPASRRELQPGEPLMVDLHAMFMLGLGDHAHNYLLESGHTTPNVACPQLCGPRGPLPADLPCRHEPLPDSPTKCSISARKVALPSTWFPGFEHGIGMMGDEWRIGLNDGPFPYWTNPDHVYQAGEMVICAMQYACPEEEIGFRYENPILITEDGCEAMSKFPLAIEEI